MTDTPGPTAAPRPEPMRWEIPVLDVHDRRRVLVVTVSEGHVVLLLPGESCIVPQASDTQLCEAVWEARQVEQQLRRDQP